MQASCEQHAASHDFLIPSSNFETHLFEHYNW